MTDQVNTAVPDAPGRMQGNQWETQLTEARGRVEALSDELSLTLLLSEELTDLLKTERGRTARLLNAISDQNTREKAAADELDGERDARTEELARFAKATGRADELLAAMTEKCRAATQRAVDLKLLLDVQDARIK